MCRPIPPRQHPSTSRRTTCRSIPPRRQQCYTSNGNAVTQTPVCVPHGNVSSRFATETPGHVDTSYTIMCRPIPPRRQHCPASNAQALPTTCPPSRRNNGAVGPQALPHIVLTFSSNGPVIISFIFGFDEIMIVSVCVGFVFVEFEGWLSGHHSSAGGRTEDWRLRRVVKNICARNTKKRNQQALSRSLYLLCRYSALASKFKFKFSK